MEEGGRVREGDVIMESQVGVMQLKTEEEVTSYRIQAASRNLKRQKT